MSCLVTCPRCEVSVEIPELSPEQRTQIASTCREDGRVLAMKMLKESFGLSLKDAKVVAMHVSGTPGVCHRCDIQLESTVTQQCKACQSLNLDW